MKFFNKFITAIIILISVQAFSQNKYKCLVQMSHYQGEGAYLVVSLINPKGEYEKTLYMFGDDEQWHNNLENWYEFHEKKTENIDAITGASIWGGRRKVIMLELDFQLINKGYNIRFESVVENYDYHKIDAEIPFSSDKIFEKTQGKGYIRYVKINKNIE